MADSKTLLADAIRKLARVNTLDKISVNDIIEEANVSRQTFYKYFVDKYSLAFYVYLQGAEKLVEQYEIQKDFDAMNRNVLKVFQNDPKFYRNIFKNSHQQNSFQIQFHKFSVDCTVSMIGKLHADPDVIELIDMWSSGTSRLIANWVTNGMKEDPEWLVELFHRSMPPELATYLLND